ncbi:MAG TPA: hypothetical protein VGE09_11185 [Pseudoxanthomonas sp.]
MHRIDGPGATLDGQFTEGDPTQGVPATTVTGAWLNALQEEIAGVVEAAGLALEKANNGQLLEAILAHIAANQDIGFETGDVKLTLATAAPAGWVMANDGTIGKTGSGATARANDDTEALYTLLWTNVADGFAPVSGGRGASAAADWAAGKTIGLTKMLGRALAIAGAGSGLTSRQLGQTLGAETHVLTIPEMPAHTHSEYAWNAAGASTVGAAGGNFGQRQTGSTGGDQPHNNMQPTAFLNAMVKL